MASLAYMQSAKGSFFQKKAKKVAGYWGGAFLE
jgi:hypothetical protein